MQQFEFYVFSFILSFGGRIYNIQSGDDLVAAVRELAPKWPSLAVDMLARLPFALTQQQATQVAILLRNTNVISGSITGGEIHLDPSFNHDLQTLLKMGWVIHTIDASRIILTWPSRTIDDLMAATANDPTDTELELEDLANPAYPPIATTPSGRAGPKSEGLG
jgi:hypothetical protein